MATLQDYLSSDCALVKPSREMFETIYHHTHGKPCDGCFDNNSCVVRSRLELLAIRDIQSRKIVHVETNAQVALRLGITKRQVAKMRKAGEL